MVAPRSGAWIEISAPDDQLSKHYESLPARGRGLKYHKKQMSRNKYESLPARGRGLKWAQKIFISCKGSSLPARGRGLKWRQNPTV